MAECNAGSQRAKLYCVILPDADSVGNNLLVISRHNALDNLVRSIFYYIWRQLARNLLRYDYPLAIRAHFGNHVGKVLDRLALRVSHVLRAALCINVLKQPVGLFDNKQMLQSGSPGAGLLLRDLTVLVHKYY